MTASTARVLVVDDNEMNRDMLSRRLRRQGFNVDVAENGEKALEQVLVEHYGLVLLDIMMPGLDGYAVLERLKADAQTQRIPVIMISAVDDLDSVVRCIEMGAEDYLFKPFNPVLLKARVEATISKSHRLEPALIAPHVEAMSETLESLSEAAALDPNQIEALQTHVNALQALLN